MRSLLVLGLVAAALAASGRYSSSKWEPEERTHIREHVTRPGREYRFEYNGQVASGLPQASEQHSATRVQALVSVFVKDPQNAVMKIRQVRFGSLNKVVAEPREIVPFDACEEIEIQPEHEQCLKMPVRVRYEQGLVRDLEFDQQDQPWCKNIKKAIVNLMQVNLQKNGRTDLDEIRKLGREEDSEQKTQDFYLATEKGLEGECEHSYTVVPQPRQSQDDSSIERLQVTKSVNFEKCTRRPDLRYNLRFGSECKSCEKKFAEDEKNTESSTVFNYNITRRGQNYLVREAEVKSQYVFAPLAQSENVITTHSLGRLVLNDIQENVQVPEPRSPKTEDIVFSVEYDEKKELFHMNGDEDYLEYFPYGDLSNKVALMDKVIGQMLKHMTSKDNSIDAEAPHMMARLVKLLRWATKEDLQKLIRTYYTESQQLEQEAIVKVQGIFADCLAIAGTKNTIEALSQMIQEKKISPVKASQVIKALVNLPVPSEKQIDTLLRLCQSSQSERNPILKQSCWLTTGAVMNALCAENKEKFAVEMMRDEKMMCPRQLKEKYVKVLMEQYHKAETRYEKVLALKTLANAGLDMSVMELEKIIRNERLDKTVRIQAIDALRLLRDQMPRKIQNILMPVLKNKYEHPEIRMNCYYQIMETLPQRHILDQIAAQLRFEPSQQLQSFVYTHMMQLANSTNPCQIQLADDLKTSLRVAHVQPPRKLLQSRFQHLPLYWQQTLTGASLNWAAIFSNNSFVPKEMMASIDTVFAGEWNKYALQFGLSQQNVDQLIAKLAEILKMDKLENIVVRGKRATGPAQDMLRDLFKSLQIRGRKGESQEAHAMLYMRYKGLDYAFLPIDQETIPETIKNTLQNGQFKLAAIERFLATGYNFDTSVATYFYESTRKIATSIGMPLVISGKLPTVLSIRGQIKVDLTPKDSQKLTGAKVRMMLEPRISATHITKMEVWCPITNNGIKVLHQLQAVLPIESTIQITKEAEILAIETSYKMPTQEKRLLAVQSRPVTFTRQWQKNGRVYTEAKEKTCMSEMMDDHVDIDKVYGEDEFGVRMNIDGHWHRSILRERQPGQPSPLLVGNNYLVCVFQPTDQTPKEIKTRIEIENIDEMESMEDPEMDNFYSKKVQFGSEEDDLFETEDFEGFDEDEQERRQHFKRYTKSISSSSKGYKHRLTAKFETVGGVRRQGEFVLQSVCDEELRVCKWDIKCEHTPFTRAQSSKWTLQAKIQAVYPKMAYTLQELKEQKHREFTLQMDAKWGTQKKSQMTVKIQGEQNAEQKKWMQHVEMEQNEKKQPVEIYEQMLEASQLNQYKMVVEYDLTPKAQNYFNQMYETLKAWYYRQCEITLTKTSDNQITAKLTIDPRYRQLVNFTVETPVERLRLLDVQLPVKVQPLNIRRELSSYRSLSSLVKKGVVGPLAECVVKSTRVNTFDDVLYKAPISTCYSVLAKDCSDEESKFVVLMKKISQNSEEKKLKVISQEHVIEIEQPKNDEPLEITVNGKKLNKQQQRQLQEYNIELKQEGELVTIELDDVTVHFDGYSARVQLSPLYLSQQCGICGHYDGERSDEFRRNDNELTDDLQDFHRSYLHRDQECEMDEEEYSAKHYRRFDSEEQDREEQEQSIFAYDEDEDQEFLENEEQESREQPQQRRHRKFQKKSQQEESSEETEEQRQTKQPIKRTRVIERSSEVCFSSRPVPECPRQTYPQEPVEKDVKFACFPRSHSKVREMLRQARTGVVDVEGEKNSFVEPIRVPTLCSVY